MGGLGERIRMLALKPAPASSATHFSAAEHFAAHHSASEITREHHSAYQHQRTSESTREDRLALHG